MKKLIAFLGFLLIGNIASAAFKLNPVTGKLDLVGASSPISIDAGDRANLALYFSTNTNTGFYRSLTWNGEEEAFTIVAGGHEVMTAVYFPSFTTDGLMVGIGTRFPQNTLHVMGGLTLQNAAGAAANELKLLDVNGVIRFTYGGADANTFINYHNAGFYFTNGNNYPRMFIDANADNRATHVHIGTNHSVGNLGFGPVDIYSATGTATLNVYGSLGVGNNIWSGSSVPVNGIVVEGQGIFMSSMTLSGARPVSEIAPTSGQALAWNGSAWTPTTITSGSGGFWIGTATSDLNAQNYGFFSVSTNSWRCTLIGGTTLYWDNIPAKSDQKYYLLQVHAGTATFVEAVADGVRFGGVSGSTGAFTAWMQMAQMTLQSAAAPTMTTAGDIGYDTTDMSIIGRDSNRNFIVARSTVPLFDVAISSGTGWDNLAFKVYTAPSDMAVTVTNCWSSVQGGTSVTFNLDERARATPATSGTNMTSSAIVAATTGTGTTVFSNGNISATNQIFFVTGSSAASGSVGTINITCEGELDVE